MKERSAGARLVKGFEVRITCRCRKLHTLKQDTIETISICVFMESACTKKNLGLSQKTVKPYKLGKRTVMNDSMTSLFAFGLTAKSLARTPLFSYAPSINCNAEGSHALSLNSIKTKSRMSYPFFLYNFYSSKETTKPSTPSKNG